MLRSSVEASPWREIRGSLHTTKRWSGRMTKSRDRSRIHGLSDLRLRWRRRTTTLPEDSMPLFLSNGAEEPRQRGFGTGRERLQDRRRLAEYLQGRHFRGGAAAIAFRDSVGRKSARAVCRRQGFAARRVGGSVGAAQTFNPQPAAATQLANVGPPTPVLPSTAGVQAVAARREGHARRYRSRAPGRAAEPDAGRSAAHRRCSAGSRPPVRRLDADELATLLKRAKGLIAIGDIAPARLLLERAADAQEPSAALLLAQTYDPAVLGTPDMRSITPDPAKARDWYQKAARLGSLDARQRLAQMQN